MVSKLHDFTKIYSNTLYRLPKSLQNKNCNKGVGKETSKDTAY